MKWDFTLGSIQLKKKKEIVYYTVTDQMEEKIFSKQSNESSCVVNM